VEEGNIVAPEEGMEGGGWGLFGLLLLLYFVFPRLMREFCMSA
jgi:hypothetical protein